MTQTQDEQNVGTPVNPAQDGAAAPVTEATTTQPAAAEPVAENNAVSSTETPNEEASASPAQVSEPATTSEPIAQAQWNSLMDTSKGVVSDTLNTGMDKIQWVWQAGVEWVQNAASQWIESMTSTLGQWGDVLKEGWQNTIEWIKGVWDDLKNWLWNIVAWATSGGWVVESGTAVVGWTVETTANVVWNAATNAMDTGTTVVSGAAWAVTNVATWATNVVTDSVNNVVWAVLPGEAGKWVSNLTNTVSQWAQNLWTKATDTIKDAGETAKWFFTGLWGNIKWSLSSKDAQKVMDDANAPVDMSQQPVAPQVAQPAAPQAAQPAAPQAAQPAAEVQPWDIQQPTAPAV